MVVGGYRFVSERVLGVGLALWRADRPAGAAAVAVGIDGKFAGVLILADELRAGTQALLQSLRALGVERIVLATGDRHDVAELVARGLSIDVLRSELTPDQKTLVVLSERKHGPVMGGCQALVCEDWRQLGWTCCGRLSPFSHHG